MNKHILIELPAPPPIAVPALFLQVSDVMARGLVFCDLAIDLQIRVVLLMSSSTVRSASLMMNGPSEDWKSEKKRMSLGCR